MATVWIRKSNRYPEGFFYIQTEGKGYKQWRSDSPRDCRLQFLFNRTHTELLPSICKQTQTLKMTLYHYWRTEIQGCNCGQYQYNYLEGHDDM